MNNNFARAKNSNPCQFSKIKFSKLNVRITCTIYLNVGEKTFKIELKFS
jgi:hypothetical protein